MASKFKKGRSYRARKHSSSDEEDDSAKKVSDILEETKETQKFRERQRGVSATALALGKKLSKVEELIENDPFKLKTGGIVNLRDVKDRNRDRSDDLDRDVANMGSTFAAETNTRDEEAEMMKFIEDHMEREKRAEREADKNEPKYKSPEDRLYELPENLKTESQKRSEEMLSNQMLSGIPEVDLGVESKIKNIEATEEAKQKHIEESRRKKKNTTSFVPTNMAVNYVQHARYMHEELKPPTARYQKQPEPPKPKPVVVGDAENPERLKTEKPSHSHKKPSQSEKATDDYHYERFRKQLRRY